MTRPTLRGEDGPSQANRAIGIILEEHQAQIMEELSRHRFDMERLISLKMQAVPAQNEVVDLKPTIGKPQKSTPLTPQGDLQEPSFEAPEEHINRATLSPSIEGVFSDTESRAVSQQSEARQNYSVDDPQDEVAKRKKRTGRVIRRTMSGNQSEISTSDRRFPRLKAWVRSGTFESIAGILIITNAVFIGIEIELSIQMGSPPWAVQVIGLTYTLAFALELLLRLVVDGCSMFWRRQYLWNLLDLFVVLCSLWEVLVLVLEAMMPDLSMNAGIGVISSLRIVRILRITRLIRNTGSSTGGAMKVLRALRTLIHSIVYTLKEVVWAAVFLFLIMYVFSLAITQGVAEELRTAPSESRLLHYWGGIPSAMSTCFMAVTGGISWEVASDPLLKISFLWWLLFITYVGFTVFAVLNVMTGVFCQSAIKSAQHDTDLFLQNMLVERDEHLKRIKDLFSRLDNDGSGSLTLAELEEHLGDPAVQAYFASMELSITDVWSFFKLLDSDLEAEISPETFFEGCQRLKGFARSLDLAKLMHQSQSMAKKQVEFMNTTDDFLAKIWEKLS